MKKIISTIVAFLMILQLFSGVVYSQNSIQLSTEVVKLSLSDCSEKSSGVTGNNIAKDQWITFNVDVLKTANYRLTSYAQFSSGTYAEILIDGNSMFTKEYKQKYQSFGKTELLEGEHEIKICVTAGELKNFSYLKIACVDYNVTDERVCQVEAEDYYSTTVSEYYHVDCQCTDYYSGSIYSNSGLIYLETTCNAVYNLVAQSDGLYTITLYASQSSKPEVPINIYNGERLAGIANILKTNSFTLERPTVVENIPLSKGSNLIKLENNTSGVRIFYMTVEKTGDGISFSEVYDADDEKIIDGSKIKRGTDVLKLEFSENVLASSLSAKTIKLTNSEDTEIPLEFMADGKNVYVSLAETLDYNETYTLFVSGVKEESGLLSTGEKSVSFETKGEDEDGGFAVVEIKEQGNNKNTVIIDGVIKNAKEVGVKGRKISLTFDSLVVSEAVSTDEGRFSLRYDMSQDKEAGVYAFYVSGEYVTESLDVIVDYQPDENTTDSDDEYNDVDIPNETDEARIFALTLADASQKSLNTTSEAIPKDEWAEFEIDIEQAGAYRVITRSKYDDNTSVSLLIDGKKVFGRAYDNKRTYQTLGLTSLSEGKHTVRLNVTSGKITSLQHLRFVCVDYAVSSNEEYKIESEDYLNGTVAQDNHVDNQCTDYYSGSTISNAGCIYLDKTCEVSYNIIAQDDGLYKLNLYGSQSSVDVAPIDIYNGETLVGYANIEKTSSFTLERATVVEEIPLFKGNNKIKLLNNSTGVRLFFMTIERVSDTVELKGVYDAEDNLLANGSKIKRGNDTFKLEFNCDISEEASVILESTDKKVVPVEISVEKKDIYVYVKETLDYNKNYRLRIGSINDKNGWFVSKEKNYLFTTKGQNDDGGVAEIEIISEGNEYRNIIIEGIIKGSSGIGVKGRKAILMLDGTEVKEILSGDNGVFVFEYLLSENMPSGMYVFSVSGEYIEEPETVIINYISQSDEKIILDNLRKTKTPEDVKQLLNEFKDVFGIDLDKDMESISDKDAVYAHLISADVKSGKELKTLYNTYIALEMINQATGKDMIDTVLKDKTKSSYLMLHFDKNELIIDKRDDFLQEILDLEKINEVSKMTGNLNDLTDKFLAKEYDKETSVSVCKNVSVYEGQGIEITLDFEKYGKNIKEIRYVISVSSKEILNGAEINLKTSADVKTETKENKLYITVAFTKVQESLVGIGTVMLTAPYGNNEYNVSISGNVIYDERVGCDITTLIEENVVLVNVSSNSSKPQGGGAPQKGGNKGGGITNNPETSGKDEEISSKPFDDIDNVPWALEAITELKKREIISDSEDNCFNPGRNVTREEFVKMLVCAMKLDTEGGVSSFKDLDSNAWYYRYVATAEEEKLVTGDENGNFNVGANIKRQDMAVLIYRILLKKGYSKMTDTLFTDDAQVSEYAKDAVYTLKKMGLMNGTGNGAFEPNATATRAQAAKVIFEMIKAVEK